MPRDETLENPFLIQSKPLKHNVEIIKQFGKRNDPNAVVDRMGKFQMAWTKYKIQQGRQMKEMWEMGGKEEHVLRTNDWIGRKEGGESKECGWGNG